MARKFIPTPTSLLVRGDEVYVPQSQWEIESDGRYGHIVLKVRNANPYHIRGEVRTEVYYGTQSGASRRVVYAGGASEVVVERV